MTGREVFTVEDVVALAEALCVGAGTLLEVAFAFANGTRPEAALARD